MTAMVRTAVVPEAAVVVSVLVKGRWGAIFAGRGFRAFARMRSFRMIATMATLAGFPALIMAWYLDLNWGLNRMALRAAMSRAFLARARPPRIDRFPRGCPLSVAAGARPH